MTAEQILKLGILRKRQGLNYRSLSFATSDSVSVRSFLNLEIGRSFSKSALNTNLKMVKESTWEKAYELLLKYAVSEEIEEGKFVRGDCTTVRTNIHYPTDASLLNDVNRVLCRLMREAREIAGDSVVFVYHTRRSKKKLFSINNSRGEERKHLHYLELIRVTRETHKEAESVSKILPLITVSDLMAGLSCQKVGLLEGQRYV